MISVNENIERRSTFKKTDNAFNLFWLGFTLYTLSNTVYIYYWVINDKLTLSLQILGLLMLVPATLMLIKFEFENEYLKILFILLVFWTAITVFRGLKFEYQFLKRILFNSWNGLFLYLVPVVLLFPKNLVYFKKVFTVIIVLGVFYIFYDLIFFKYLFYFFGDSSESRSISNYLTFNLAIPSGFMLLTYIYHTNKKILFSLFVCLLGLIIVIIRARRTFIFVSLSILVIAFMFYLYLNKVRLIRIFISFILVSSALFYGYKIIDNNSKNTFNLIYKRLNEDTRTYVEENFYHDMEPKDLIFGRGIDGQYKCPGIETYDTGYRYVVETGYLQIILNGGLIYLALILLISLPAVIKGLLYSKNTLSKAGAIWILLFLIFSYPAIINTFTLNYILFWLSVGICYSGKLRNLTDNEVKEIFLKGYLPKDS